MTAALIAQRRTQMVIHSYLYYVLDQPIVSDATWQRWADELVQLQAAHPGPVNDMDQDFADWTGDTGMHLPQGGAVHAHAMHLLKLHEAQQQLPAHQVPELEAPVPAAAVDAGQLVIGRQVSTNYNTGPYIIKHVYGPCTCSEYVRSLSGDKTPSEPHYHLTVLEANPPKGKRDITGYLAGFRGDGTNVWSDDRLIFGDLAPGTQQDLFGF